MRKFFLLLLLCICCCIFASGCNLLLGKSQPTTFTWKTADPKDKGMDAQQLDELDNKLSVNKKITSLLIVKDDDIVFEKYYNGGDPNKPNGVFSVTKSIMSALTGIAIDQGLIGGLDTKVSEIMPEYFVNEQDSRKKDITVKNALTLTGGLKPADDDFQNFINSPDLFDFAIKQPIVNTPGTKFAYNTGLTQFLSAMITKQAKMSTREFADRNLFGPLGIQNYYWMSDSNGINVGGTNLTMVPRDMAKFGLLYLHKGKWQGKQIVPMKWVTASTERHISTNTTEPGDQYGYLFWLADVKGSDGKSHFSYEANGYGGQIIRVIPDLKTVIVMTFSPFSQEKADPERMLREDVIPVL
ncbi:serine hydrolase domain-containing protein [Cohnella terricola]|uniref:Serine hydrolase n=1 Tax=Cohnella terricola TaxID=1289167 RepID=A0A559J9U7_9BACL|nr:serine hydrolase [Cohnella terricola]TVX96624.1 serine hydrolase [Cohnella terricola]